MTYELRYKPDTPLGKQFSSWWFGRRSTYEACEAVRKQCPNADMIEVVHTDGHSVAQNWTESATMAPQVKRPDTEFAPPAGPYDHPLFEGEVTA